MSEFKNISIVIPLLNEEESLPELCAWIHKVMQANNFSYEVILVDDGSTDNSWNVIGDIAAANNNCKGIKFNRNYGKSAALQTGFTAAAGDVIITMDADLQDNPEEIPELYKMIREQGFDLVSGWKKKRFDPLSKTIPTKLFNWVTSKISGIRLHDFNCGLKAYNHRVVKSIEVYGEMHRYIPVIAKWNGYKKIGEKVVQHQERKYGVTKFGLERFVYGFLDLLSITFVSKFRRRPMHFFGTFGSLSFLFGFVTTFFLIIEKIYNIANHIKGRDITDNTWFYLSLVAVVIGVQLFLSGYIAEMITLNSTKKNDYIIADKTRERSEVIHRH